MPVPDHQNWLHHLRRGFTDLWFMLSVIVAVTLLIVLIDYHPSDPGWSASGHGETQHILGTPAAYIADTLLSLLGYSAYLIPIGLLVMGWQSVQRTYLDAELMAWKTLSLVVVVGTLSGIFALHWPVMINSLAVSGGGMLGQKMSMLLIKSWPVWLVMLSYSMLFFIGITLLMEIHWCNMFERLGRIFLGLFGIKADKKLPSSQSEVISARRDAIRERIDPSANAEPELPLSWQQYKVRDENNDVRLNRAFTETNTPAEDGDSPSTNQGNWFDAKGEEDNEPVFQFDDLAISSTDDTQDDSAAVPPIWQSSDATDTVDNDQEAASTSQQPATSSASIQVLPSSSTPLATDASTTITEEVPVPSTAPSQKHYMLPSPTLLRSAPLRCQDYSPEELEKLQRDVEDTLRRHQLDAIVVNTEVGPVITHLELDLAPDIKVNQVANLDSELARVLAVPSVRVVDVIPGKPYIGLEIPNRKREIARLRSVLESSAYEHEQSPLTLVLGVDVTGQPVVTNLAQMPHLLMAAMPGVGKSVGMNVLLTSMLYKSTPEQLKLILIDLQMQTMAAYADIPHLLTPIVSNLTAAENALRWVVAEIDRRHQLMTALKMRSIDGFNQHIRECEAAGESVNNPLQPDAKASPLKSLPHIVMVINELADVISSDATIETLITQITQKARTTGIHLILATEHPSIDVLTGTIKNTIPARIAFQVATKTDSRTIIDQQGAEALLGQGDLLFVPPGSAAPQRVHGAFIDDDEVNKVTSYIKTQETPRYEHALNSPLTMENSVTFSTNNTFSADTNRDDTERDPLYDEAVAMVTEHRKASISWLQRQLNISYSRSARLIEVMEQEGIVSPPERGARKVLVGKSDNYPYG